jgi:hypothetical protein
MTWLRCKLPSVLRRVGRGAKVTRRWNVMEEEEQGRKDVEGGAGRRREEEG